MTADGSRAWCVLTAAIEPGTWLAILGLASLSIVSTAVGVALAVDLPPFGVQAMGSAFLSG